MVNLKALEAAINKVENLRDIEHTFAAGTTTITLRPLRPDEDTEISRYAQVAMEGTQDDEPTQSTQTRFADFMDRLRHATLGFSIVQIDDVNLRGVEYIETGEVDDQGRALVLPKWEAVRDMVAAKWERFMLAAVFAQFGEMLERLEDSAQKKVKFDTVDLDEEIGRTQRRLNGLLEAKRKSETTTEEDLQRRQQDLVLQVQKAQQDQREHLRDAQREVAPNTVEATPPSASGEIRTQASAAPRQGRSSAIPIQADEPPPDREAPDVPLPPPPEKTWEQVARPSDGDSFFDPTDPDAALAEENARQQVLHQHRLQREQEQQAQREAREAAGIEDPQLAAREFQRDSQRASASPRSAARLDARTGGLRSAANTNNAVFDAGANSIRSGRPTARPRPPERPGVAGGAPATLHGKQVYKMSGTQVLDRSSREQASEPLPPINPEGGSRNRNFRGPGET